MLHNRFWQKMVGGLVLSAGLNVAYASDVMKFGYVNAERVYSESKTAQGIEATLQKEFGAQQRKLNELQAKGVELQKRLASGKLKPHEIAETERKFQEFGSQYRLESARFVEEYNLRRTEEFVSLQRNANRIIQEIANQEQYDLIVQEAVFVKGKYDITDRVIQLLDKSR